MLYDLIFCASVLRRTADVALLPLVCASLPLPSSRSRTSIIIINFMEGWVDLQLHGGGQRLRHQGIAARTQSSSNSTPLLCTETSLTKASITTTPVAATAAVIVLGLGCGHRFDAKWNGQSERLTSCFTSAARLDTCIRKKNTPLRVTSS